MRSAEGRQRSWLAPCSWGPSRRRKATVAIVASGIIGSVTFMGSLVAFDKLLGLLLPDAPVTFFGQQPLNFLLGLVALGFGAWLVADPSMTTAYVGVVAVGSVLGVLLTISIGGADMPHRDRAAELVLWSGGCRDRLRAEQRYPDHHRVTRRRVGNHSDANHV